MPAAASQEGLPQPPANPPRLVPGPVLLGLPPSRPPGSSSPAPGSVLPVFTRGDSSRRLAGSPVGSSREVPQPRGCHTRWRGAGLASTSSGAGPPEPGAPAAAPFVREKAPCAGTPAPLRLTGTIIGGCSGRPCIGSRCLDSPRGAAPPGKAGFVPCDPGNVLGSLGYCRFLPVPGRDLIFVPERVRNMHREEKGKEMLSLMENPHGEGQRSSAHRLKLVWETVGLRSLGTKGKGRAGKIATAETTSSPVHKTNVSPFSLPRSSCIAVGPGDLPVPATPSHG